MIYIVLTVALATGIFAINQIWKVLFEEKIILSVSSNDWNFMFYEDALAENEVVANSRVSNGEASNTLPSVLGDSSAAVSYYYRSSNQNTNVLENLYGGSYKAYLFDRYLESINSPLTYDDRRQLVVAD